MTFKDFVDYVCTKTQLVEDDDKAACKLFVSKRYELIYDAYLWKDALGAIDITLDPVNNPDHAEGTVLCPEVVNRVVAVRTAERSVRVRGLEDFYRVDVDRFSAMGSPIEFALLSPLWMVWRGYAGLKIVTADADKDTQFKVLWADETGARNVQLLKNGATLNSKRVPKTQIIPAGAHYGDVVGPDPYSSSIYYLAPTTAGKVYFYSDVNDGQAGDQIQQLLNDGARVPNNSYFIAGELVVLAGQFNENPITAKIAIAEKSRIEIEACFKPITADSISFNPQLAGDVDGGLLAKDITRSPNYQRIRLFSIPQASMTLSVLGKKQFVPLTFDSEEPLIKNLDNCLIAFVTGDMLERARQFGKAQTKYGEAGVLLKELAKLETMQAANNSRIIPDGGFGDPFFDPGRSGFFP